MLSFLIRETGDVDVDRLVGLQKALDEEFRHRFTAGAWGSCDEMCLEFQHRIDDGSVWGMGDQIASTARGLIVAGHCEGEVPA